MPAYVRTIQHHLQKKLIQQTHFKESRSERIVNRWNRMPWCWEKRRWNVQGHWDKIIFADESKVDEKVYIRYKDNEGWRYGKPRSKIFQVTIWVYICWHGLCPIIKVDRNINGLKYIDIIDSQLCPVLSRHFLNNSHLFQDGKAQVYRARLVIDFMTRNRIRCMSRRTQSRDIYIIENLWLLIKRKLQFRLQNIKSNDDLFNEIRHIWEDIKPEYIHN